MPCRVEHTEYWPPKKTQTYVASRLMTFLQRYLGETLIKDKTTDQYPEETSVPDLCAKIKELGGTPFLKKVVEDNQPEGLWETMDYKDAKELAEWWVEHEWRDGIRERMEQRRQELREEQDALLSK